VSKENWSKNTSFVAFWAGLSRIRMPRIKWITVWRQLVLNVPLRVYIWAKMLKSIGSVLHSIRHVDPCCGPKRLECTSEAVKDQVNLHHYLPFRCPDYLWSRSTNHTEHVHFSTSSCTPISKCGERFGIQLTVVCNKPPRQAFHVFDNWKTKFGDRKFP
jgi:hypothetical protein